VELLGLGGRLGGVVRGLGAVVGALFMGVASSLVAFFGSPVWSDFTFFGVLIVVLLVRPQGMFGTTLRGAS